MDADAWLVDRVAFIKGMKSPSDAQRLLVALHEKPERSAVEAKKLALLIAAERSADRASKARAAAMKFLREEDRAAAMKLRKARDHALYQSAGLLILAGLVDSKSGEPRWDRGTLLGGLLFMADVLGQEGVSVDGLRDAPQLRGIWKRAGDALLAEREKQG